jgi:hypothetical protein
MIFKKLCCIVISTGMAFLLSSCAVGTPTSKTNNQSTTDIASSFVESKSGLFSGVDSSTLDNPQNYSDPHFNFTVNYPVDWKVSVEKYQKSTSSQEGSPDGGIDIYVEGNKNDTIRIFGQYGTIDTGIIDFSYSTNSQENFVTTSGLVGKLYYNASNQSKQAVVLFDAHHAVQLKITDATFTRDKQQIFAILKSIKIIKGK